MPALIMTWDEFSIRTLRRYLNLTQQQLADQVGCRQQTVSEWEMGMYLPKNAYTRLLNQFRVAKGIAISEIEAAASRLRSGEHEQTVFAQE